MIAGMEENFKIIIRRYSAMWGGQGARNSTGGG